MDKLRRQVQQIAASRGVTLVEDWHGIDCILPLLEKVRLDGTVVVVKLTGVGRAPEPYMALFTGGTLQHDFVRVTGTVLEEVVARALVNYARRAWKFTG